jgi:SAM-dependent methyltransferase
MMRSLRLASPAVGSPVFSYKGALYPDYIKTGNAVRFITQIALQFCQGNGVDVGAGGWPLPGAQPIDVKFGGDAMKLPEGPFDYVFSSHALEHLVDPVGALEHWKSRLRPGGVLFLYLPHPDMTYWLPQNNRKHLHTWTPQQMHRLVEDLGFNNVLSSDRDLAWSFAVVGFAPEQI